MKIGILGGTFDPIHKVHIEMANIAYRDLRLDKVLFMPSFIPPHKNDKKVSSYEDRLSMLEIALNDKKEFEICELEANKKGTSYTKITLELLKDKYIDSEFYFIMGADSFYEIDTWYEYKEIFKLATIVVFDRTYKNNELNLYKIKEKYELELDANIFILEFKKSIISSTYIRNTIYNEDFDINCIDENVLKYIKEHRLYTDFTMRDFYDIKDKLKSSLKRDRYEHSLSVAYTAASLAMAHGENINLAFLAGLLHDCAKNKSNKELIDLCNDAGIILDDNDLKSPQTLHAVAGVVVARNEYKIEEEYILSAISLHTTGDINMSNLDKIIFVADYIEPLRENKNNLEFLRKLAFTDLTNAVYNITKDTISYLEDKDIYINTKTLACLEFLEENGIYDK